MWQMKTFSTLLALCDGNPPVTGGFPSQKTMTWSFDVFFDPRLNKRLCKQSRRQWFESPPLSLWHHCNKAEVSQNLIRWKHFPASQSYKIFNKVSQCYCRALCNIAELNVHFVRIRCILRPIHQAIIRVNNIIHPTFSRFLWNSLCLSVKHEHKQLWLETRPTKRAIHRPLWVLHTFNSLRPSDAYMRQ